MDLENEPEFALYSDLASEKIGGRIIFATDDFFAEAELMLKFDEPHFIPGVFTTFGKEYDGWETRRKRKPGHDWCIVQLGCPGIIHGIEISTRHFVGNYPPHASIQAGYLDDQLPAREGRRIGSAALPEELNTIERLNSEAWNVIVPVSPLQPGTERTHRNLFTISDRSRVTHIRLNMLPDGGIARLRVFGEACPNWTVIPTNQLMDLVAMVNGGICVLSSNAHYGHARNITLPGRAAKMDEGWETARRKDRPTVLVERNGQIEYSGSEWAVFRLGHKGKIENVEIDTNHFKGNFPDTFSLEGTTIENIPVGGMVTRTALDTATWLPILLHQKLGAHQIHAYPPESLCERGPFTHVRLTITPDGGISRMKVMGYTVHV